MKPLFLGMLSLFCCSAFWWHQPQELADGDYRLTISGSGDPIVKEFLLVSAGDEIALKSDEISITGFVSGSDVTAYSVGFGGMLIHGVITNGVAKGDGVIRYKSKAPAYISFLLAPTGNPTHNNSHTHTEPHKKTHTEPVIDNTDVTVVEEKNTEEPEFGKFKDIRDGQEYGTAKIGSRTWMTQNLRYNTNDGGAYLNFKNPDATYGRLYIWASAKKACPTGWHLPTDDEWKEAIAVMGADAVLDMKFSSGWSHEGNGSNKSGFAILPAGFFNASTKVFSFLGESATFWTDTEYFGPDAYAYTLAYSDKAIRRVTNQKGVANSCRCVKD